MIERDTPGFECTARYHTMGGENLAEIRFENCELPLENLLIKEDGFRKLLSAFNTQRCLNPSISLGLAEGAFEESGQVCARSHRFRQADRRVPGDPPQARGDVSRYRSRAARFFIVHARRRTRSLIRYMAAIAKITVNEMSLRVTSEAIQIHGGYGFTDEFPVSRYYRGARYGTLGGGTTETLKELVGKKMMSDFPIDGFLGMHTF